MGAAELGPGDTLRPVGPSTLRRMRAARRLVFVATVAAAGVLSGPGAGAAAVTPPTPPTTVPGAATTVTGATPTGSVPSAVTVAPVPTGPSLPRAGSAPGGLERDRGDEWDVRRLATTAAFGLLALTVAGHIYGRLQSIAPSVGRTIARRD